jgi:hypothetical protein
MAFSPVSLPIQEILLTNFVTDIATISNANDLLLQDKLEDLINLFEIDLNTLAIGTDNPINYVRADSFIIQNTGLTFQTGTPTQIIASLQKNANTQSVLTVDNINNNILIDTDSLIANDVTINNSLTVGAPAVANSTFQYNSSIIESKESVILNLTKSALASTEATARLTLTSTSRKNIFVKLKATTSPTLNFAYDGVSAFAPSITSLELYVDFDTNNPPVQNTQFTIHIVDIIDEFTSTSIIPAANSGTLPLKVKAGNNLSTSTPIILHSNSGNVGVNPSSTNFAGSAVLNSNVHRKYGHNISILYILDENLDDRLIIDGMVGMEFF